VITEQNSRAALSVIKKNAAVDLVIIEEHLPDMDGLALVASLKAFKPAIPLVMMTTQCSIETYLKAVNLGVLDYLDKPVSARLMGSVIKVAIYGEPLRSASASSFLDQYLD
jgi:DNA-binding NtrC family response regulator